MVPAARSFNRTSTARQSATWPPVSRKRSGRPSPSVRAWSLLLRPPRLIPIAWTSAPLSAARRAVRLHVRAVDQNLGRWSARRCQRHEQLLPHALRRPAHEPVVERLPRFVAGRRIDPATARRHDMDDAADHPPIINPGNAAHLARQQRPKPLELLFTQPEFAQIHAPAVAEPESHPSRHGNPVYGSGPWAGVAIAPSG
jgi:hypothetical protein